MPGEGAAQAVGDGIRRAIAMLGAVSTVLFVGLTVGMLVGRGCGGGGGRPGPSAAALP